MFTGLTTALVARRERELNELLAYKKKNKKTPTKLMLEIRYESRTHIIRLQ